MKRMLGRSVVLSVVGAAFGLTQTVSAPPQVSIIDLGLGSATAINDRGQVVGFYQYRAFLWQNGITTNLLPVDPYGFNGVPVAINNAGQVAGYYGGPGHTDDHPFLWQDGVLTDLGVLPGYRQCYAGRSNARSAGVLLDEGRLLTSRGQVVGTCLTEDLNSTTPFLWQDGVLTDLGVPYNVASAVNNRGQVVGGGFLWQDGKTTSIGLGAVDINERGQVVGNVYPEADPDRSYNGRAFLWQNGELTDVGTLPGDAYSEAIAINDGGQVIGLSFAFEDHGADHPRSFLWQHGTMTDLGTLGGTYFPAVYASAINNRGQIVGSGTYSTTADSGEKHGFLWQDGVLTDLGTLPGGTNSLAVAVNARGQIVGTSNTASGQFHAVLWEVRGPRE